MARGFLAVILGIIVAAGVLLGTAGAARAQTSPAFAPNSSGAPAAISPFFPQNGNNFQNGQKDNGKSDDKSDSKDNGKTEDDKDDKDDEDDEKCDSNGSPETILQWLTGRIPPPNGEEEEEDRIVTDRPDFTESSRCVGKGRIQFEFGYLYIHDNEFGEVTNAHAYPNLLVRIGLFSDWFELRLVPNYIHERTRGAAGVVSDNGFDDLQIGFRFDITEQRNWIPESSLILQMLVPTGVDEFTNGDVMPGIAYFYSWEVSDFLSIAGGTQANRLRDDNNTHFTEIAQSISFAYTLTEKIGAYTEWFAFFPTGATDPRVGPAHHMDGGFTYLITNNFQWDIFAGFGLNDHADDFFAGSGFAVRF